MDSTMLHVCKLVRANRHRVAKGIASFGKNWQGWHYGFKLHAACNPKGQLAAVYFTPANEHDTANRYLTWSMTPLSSWLGMVPTMLLSCAARCGMNTRLTSLHHHIQNRTRNSCNSGSYSYSTNVPRLSVPLTISKNTCSSRLHPRVNPSFFRHPFSSFSLGGILPCN